MGPISIDPVAASPGEPRRCAITKIVPFCFGTGEPYATVCLIVPVVLNGDADVFEGDNRRVTATYKLSAIQTSDGQHPTLSVQFSPSLFSGRSELAASESLPVIVR